jgi:hypothetical protein
MSRHSVGRLVAVAILAAACTAAPGAGSTPIKAVHPGGAIVYHRVRPDAKPVVTKTESAKDCQIHLRTGCVVAPDPTPTHKRRNPS